MTTPTDYFSQLQQAELTQLRGLLQTIAARYASTLRRVPTLAAELAEHTALGIGTDFKQLATQWDKALEQVNDFLAELDLAPIDYAEIPDLPAYGQSLISIFNLQNSATLIGKFDNKISTFYETQAQAAQAERVAEEQRQRELAAAAEQAAAEQAPRTESVRLQWINYQIGRRNQKTKDIKDAGFELMDDPVHGENSLARDTKTGLVWQRFSVGQRWDGEKAVGKAVEFTFEGAQLQQGNGWRVPTVRELSSLLHSSTGLWGESVDIQDGGARIKESPAGDYQTPTIQTDVFFCEFEYDFCWTASPYANDSDMAWIVDFIIGAVYIMLRNVKGQVRLVRYCSPISV